MKRIASATLMIAVSAGLSAADSTPALGAPPSKLGYYNTPQPIILKVADLSAVAKARFFVSPDAGKTWKLEREITVAPTARDAPKMEFRPQTDGIYTIVTCAVWRKGGAEADPQPGSVPANARTIVIDTIKPMIGSAVAKLDRANPDSAIIDVAWSASDGNFGPEPVSVEASTDGGKTFPLSFPGSAQGSMKLTVPTPKGAAAIDVRVTAKDLAGNSAQATPQSVALPPPPDPTVELKKAVSSLPTLTEIEPAAKPEGESGNSDSKPTSGTASKPASVQAIEPATASADPSRPDIIAPNGIGDTTVPNPVDGAVVTGTNVEAEFHHRVSDKSSGPESFKPQRRVETAPTDSDPETAPDAAPGEEEETSFLPNPGAEVLLEDARAKVKSGDRAGALTVYRRLHNSGAAKTAITEELDLLRVMGDQKRIVEVVDSLPPESVTDGARLQQARALVALGDQATALDALSHVRAGAPEAREAMFLIGKCFKAQGKTAQAKKVFSQLAGGTDEIATAAKGEL